MRSPSLTHARAKALRRTLSPPEVALWARLRIRRPDMPVFRRQHPIGPYIADFYCSAARLVVEIDGAGHGEEIQRLHDERRDAFMDRAGYRILRVSAADAMRDPDDIAQGIVAMASASSDR